MRYTSFPAVVCMEKNKQRREQLSTSAGLFVSYRGLSLPLLSTQLCNKWKYRRWNATLTLPHTYRDTHTLRKEVQATLAERNLETVYLSTQCASERKWPLTGRQKATVEIIANTNHLHHSLSSVAWRKAENERESTPMRRRKDRERRRQKRVG